jgi:hypothetical protein
MKKMKTRLQLTKTTVRVLQDAELAAVQGGAGLRVTRPSTDDPTACIVSGGGGAEKL